MPWPDPDEEHHDRDMHRITSWPVMLGTAAIFAVLIAGAVLLGRA